MVEQLNLVDHDDKVAKAAFRLLLNDPAPMTMGALAERIGVEQALVAQVFDHLRLVVYIRQLNDESPAPPDDRADTPCCGLCGKWRKR